MKEIKMNTLELSYLGLGFQNDIPKQQVQIYF